MAKTTKKRRGGQELPDNIQDRPEQNAGYDEAVRGRGSGTPIELKDEAEVVDLDTDHPRDADLTVEPEEET